MNVEPILEAAAFARPGYSLATFKQAALPVYLLTVRVLVLEKKPLSPIEEGCLRAVEAGLSAPAEIGSFLGLGGKVLTGVLAGLNARECINYSKAIGDREAKVTLTAKGQSSLVEAVSVAPQERVVQLIFDPYLKRVLFVPTAALSKPREAKENGWFELPLCGAKRPEVEDVPLQDLDKVIAKSRTREEESRELLALRRVERREMHFLPCLLLFYKANHGDEVQVAFYKDEAFSVEHENAFRTLGGPEQVGARLVALPAELPSVGETTSGDLKHDVAVALDVDSARVNEESKATEALVKPPAGAIQPALKEEGKASGSSSGKTLKVVRCHEHPMLLRKALGTSQKRLLIVSPWIRDQVVDRNFVGSLEALLRNGVDVYIGYGLSEDDGKVKANDQARSKSPISKRAKSDLESLQRRFKNFRFRFVGNTHRKFLVCDSKFAVSTSFNWLSFLGDPKARARDESGLLIAKPEYVEEMFRDALDLLEHGYDHPIDDEPATNRSGGESAVGQGKH